MVQRAAYWVDLKELQFAEGTATWIHALPYGSYKHPLYGSIEVSPARAIRFAQNVKDRIRGIDLDIDYDHKAKDGAAAGWVKDAKVEPDGLWLLVEWTPDGHDRIKKQEYRYFSPEFVDEWTNEHGSKFKDVMMGGALTNRPFLKDILPINLSEIESEEGDQVDEFLKALRDKLKLPEDATEEQILEAAAKAGEPVAPPDPTKVETETTDVPVPVLASEEAKKLAEDNPVVKAMMETIEKQSATLAEQGKTINTLGGSLRLSEINTQLKVWTSEGSWGIPTALHEPIRQFLLEAPVQFSERFEKLVGEILKTGLVQLGEAGFETHDKEGRSRAKLFVEKVDKLVDGGTEYAEAVQKVQLDEPELAEAYRLGVLSGELEED